MHTRNTIVIAALVAACGSAASAQPVNWLSPMDGNWNDAAGWDGGNIPNTVGEDAVLGLVGMYTVFTTNNWSLGSISITNPDATLSIGTNQHTLMGDLFNDGTVLVNTNAVFNGTLYLNSDAMISGTGSILLNGTSQVNNADLSVDGDHTATHAAGHTIRGSGRLLGSIINNGTVVADIPGAIGLQLDGTLDQTGGGSAGADGGVLRLGSGASTIGGELFTLNGGEIRAVENNHRLDGVTVTGGLVIPGEGRNLLFVSDNTIDGTVSINPDASVFNAILRIDDDLTIDGSGSIDMKTAGNLDDAQVTVNGAYTLTLESGLTVRGSGVLDASTGGTIVNRGMVIANDFDNELGLGGSHRGDGGIYLADGGVMSFRTDAFVRDAAFSSANGGMVEHNIGGSATIADSSNEGVIIVRGNGCTLEIDGMITNNGGISLNPENNIFNANLKAETNATIAGAGAVRLTATSNTNDARVHATDGAVLTVGANQTIAGSGLIETDGGLGSTVVNLGTINGDFAAIGKDPARPLELRGNHSGIGQGVYRSDDGILQLGNGLTISGANFDTSGTGVVAMTTSGVSVIDGATNTGEMAVYGQGCILSLTDDFMNEGTLTINGDTAVFNATVQFAADDVMIGGAGTVRMVTAGSINDAQLNAVDGVTGTIWFDQTVAGSGIIAGQGTMGVITNLGHILADDPAMPLELRGSHNGIITVGTGTYGATTGSVLSLGNGIYLHGGVLETVDTGEVAATAGTSTLAYGENNGLLGVWGEGATLNLVGSLTNNGTIHINSNSNVFNATLRLTTADLQVIGTGAIEMTTAGSSADAQLSAQDGFVGTLGGGQSLIGDGQINGEFSILGTIDPAGPTRLMTTDTISLDPGSVMRFDLGASVAPAFDRVVVRAGEALNLNGATAVIGIDTGYLPQFGDTWDIVDGETTGVFGEVVTHSAPFGQIYRVIYENDRVFVILTCDADLSGDGGLNFFDLSLFLNYFGSGDVRGDINGDGQFNFFDISLFIQIFGEDCEG